MCVPGSDNNPPQPPSRGSNDIVRLLQDNIAKRTQPAPDAPPAAASWPPASIEEFLALLRCNDNTDEYD